MTGDREALIAAIHQFPDDDTARLALADWLAEFCPATDRDRPELAGLQREIARQPRRIVIDNDDSLGNGVLMWKRGGPDYYKLPGATAYHYGLQVGGRVDVLRYREGKSKWYRGLRVVRTGSDEDTILCRDAGSGPDTTAPLRTRESALLAANPHWCPPCVCS